MVTPLYPIPTPANNVTHVCHYFARDWVSLGYNVKVIHIQPEYPIICRLWLKFSRFIHNNHDGGGYFYEILRHTKHYMWDGVEIYRIPVYKFKPSKLFLGSSLACLRRNVYGILKRKKFIPDVIVGHMLQIDIIPYINEKYNAKTCIISHGLLDHYKDGVNKERLYKKILEYDYVGYRSKSIKKSYEELLGVHPKSFICRSGIPDVFLCKSVHHFTEDDGLKIIYVGDLIPRKHPEALIKAINLLRGQITCDINYIGDGVMMEGLRRMSKECTDNVKIHFRGQIPRNDIIEYLDNSDVFIMVSEGEAFGLVYLEAMARGCITVGAKNEGIDGIIINGDNGFLCEAGNYNELSKLLLAISKMSIRDKEDISNKARETAFTNTDKCVAEEYLSAININD